MRYATQVRALALSQRGSLRLVAVADTHGRPHAACAKLIRQEAPDAILHAGDVGRPEVLDELEALAPTIAVRGNIDGRGELADVVAVELRRNGGDPALCILLTHIAVRGPQLLPTARHLAVEHRAELVVCGHSHVPLVAWDRGVAVFNPGSAGPRRFQLPITFGVIDVDRDGVRLRHVDCDTGTPWQPPR